MSEITTCKPNPCRHEGKCFSLYESSFICNCEDTGYKGDQCEIGYLTTPIVPKLRPNISSTNLLVLARPSRRLKVSFDAENGVTFNPESTEIQFPERKGEFTIEAEKPGIGAVTYNLEGENKNDFEAPERGAIVVAPEIFNQSTKPFLLKGEVPVGCEEYETKKNLSCEVRMLSTAPWTDTPPSTNGVVHLATANNHTIPLSLICLNLKELYLPRDKKIQTGIAKTSSSTKFSLLYQKSGKCYSNVTDANYLLELMENDAFVTSFMQTLSSVAPEWIILSVSETNVYFDIQNIAVDLQYTDLEHCSGFPLNGASSLAYYHPAVKYRMRVAQNEVPLFTDGKTCLAVGVCKPCLFINFPKGQAELLKSTLKVFRDMKDCCGIDLSVDSIGFVNKKETFLFAKGMIWNGVNLQELSTFSYDAWLKGNLEWRMEIPKLLFLNNKISGNVSILTGALICA